MRLEIQLRYILETDLGKGIKKILQHWKSPRTQWPPSFLNGRSLVPQRLFLELAARPNWAIKGEGPWSGRWTRTRWLLGQISSVEMGEPSKRTTISAALHQSGLYRRVARWKPLLSVKGTWQPSWSLLKRHLNYSDHEKQYSLVWWNQDWTLWPECQASHLEETWHHPYGHISVFIFYTFAKICKNLFLLCHYGVLFVDWGWGKKLLNTF